MSVISVKELALELGIAPRTLTRWASEGKGPPRVKHGGFVVYRRESVEQWLRENETSPPCSEITVP